MTAYIPPKKGTDDGAQTGAPVIGPRRGGGDAGTAAGENVLARNSGTTDAWLAAQRNAYANSVIPLHTATLDHPEVQATYRNHYGVETITLSPTVSPGGEQPPDEPVLLNPPNDLPELARNEIVTPQTSLYLMVLYAGDKIAAIDMEKLDAPAPVYAAVVHKSFWGQGQLRTMQLSIGGTEFVMLPLDMTGTTQATSHWLSTNALGDAVPTAADTQNYPAMNGTAKAVYTNGNAFSYEKGAFKVTATLDPSLLPYLFDTDGTSYFASIIGGSVPVRQDAIDTGLLQAQISKAIDAVETPSTTPVYDFQYTEKYLYETRTYGFNTYQIRYTISAVVDVFKVGPVYPGTGVDGYSYYASGAYGQQPILHGFKASQSKGKTESFDGTSFSFVATGTDQSDLSNLLPMPNYTNGKLEVDLVPVTATQHTEDDRAFDYGGVAGVPPFSAGARDFQYGGNNGALGTEQYEGYITAATVSVIDGNIPGPYGSGQSEATVDAYYAAQVAAVQNVVSHTTNIVAPVILNEDLSVPGQIKVTLTAPLYALQPTDPPNNYISQGYGEDIDGQVNAQEGTGYSSLGLPLTYPVKGGLTSMATVEVFGKTLTYKSSSDAGTTAAASAVAFTFPPMYDGTPALIVSTDTVSFVGTITTQYGTYPQAQTYDYQGWLHVSNGKHVIQGYVIAGTPYAFLDGGKGDWLGALCKALQCEPTDVATMVMDVTLAKIKAVAHVQAVGYTGG